MGYPKSTLLWLGRVSLLALLFGMFRTLALGQTVPRPTPANPSAGIPVTASPSAGTSTITSPSASNPTSCGQQEINEILFRAHPEIRAKYADMEQRLRTYLKNRTARAVSTSTGIGTPPAPLSAPIVLPVVVHIIHNGGPEDISDAQVMTGIQHLNEAYANTGYYDPSDGVSTNIQFCMAERDPDNNPTTGITRDISPYTVMGGPDYYSDDQNVKNIRRWNPDCYINIWVVKSIPGSVVGYAYLPPAHGTDLDGIVLEAGYFGSSYPNDVVITHEMGHYLGLYHTFQGGCTNNDCSVDGDQVCDTPPDQSTAYISCGSSMNSCTTDVLSGFATDQPDLTQDYMDYGNFNCMKVFTQGQSDRMNWFIQNVLFSLLHCKSCLPPCPSPAAASFSSPGSIVNAGSSYTFLNSSANAASFTWLVNGTQLSTSTDLPYTFNAPGRYIITLIARSGNTLCDSAMTSDTLNAVCPVAAGFTKSATTAGAGTPVNFTNTSTGATGYEWSVNGALQATSTNFSYTTITAGTYIITLRATNAAASCNQTFSDTVFFTCPVLADFIPASITTLLNTPLTFTSTGSGATGFQWAVNGAAAGTGASFLYSFPVAGSYNIQLTATNGVCSSTKTGVVYVTDKCGNAVYLFRKNYNAQTNYTWRDLQFAPDGGSVAAGRIITGAAAAGAIMKLDPGGNPQWNKSYSNGSASDLLKVRTTLDGGYIAIGDVTGSGGSSNLFVVKTAADGTLAWSRQLNTDASSTGANIIQSPEGDYYFTGSIATVGSVNGGGTDGLVGKLNAAGTLVWLQSYDKRTAATPSSLANQPTALIVCGNIQGTLGSQGFLMQLAKTDGSVTWSKTYQSSVSENFKDVLVTASGYFVDVLRSNTPALIYSDHLYLQTDGSGSPLSAPYITPFSPGSSIGFSSVFLKSDGNIVSQSSILFGGTYQNFLLQELNPAGTVVWSKTYNEPNAYLTGLAGKPDNSFFLGGFALIGSLSPLLISVDSSGNGGACPANPTTLPLLPAVYTAAQASWIVKAVQPAFISNHVATDDPVTMNTECQYIGCDSTVDSCALCKNLELSGKDSVCGLRNTLLVSAIRDTSCHSPVKWLTDPGYVNIIATTDSTIELSAIRSGLVSLIGSITTPCKTISDTMYIHVFQQPDTIDLGPDLQLCQLSTISLHAGSGFASYTWQDGSTDSTFTAYFPGTYFVNATDHCGNSYGDTIQITHAPIVPFDLGPDTTICLHDTLQLTAPQGFTSYSWSPLNYNISDPYSRTPLVWPEKDTSYTCVAQKYVGCTVVDTIHITVLTSIPKGFLSDSATFCKGSVLDLAPTGAWDDYLWSDGEKTSGIQVSAPGLYWLMVTDANKCTGRDAIIVEETDCRKGIAFPNAFSPNADGKNDVFRAILDVLPVHYSLVIYNRWGEKVFETRDPLAGWNGVFNGQLQEAGGFVWYASFQFADDKKEQMIKGTLILVR